MLYVQQSLAPGEEIIHVAHFHWMYTLGAVISIILGVAGCILVIVGGLYMHDALGGVHHERWIDAVRGLHPGIKILAFFVMILGLLQFAQMMVVKATTEICITNNRLIYKRGLVARAVGEMSIDRIEGVNVYQPVLGRILNYGRVMIRGMGVGELILPPIIDPVGFRRAIERARQA